MARACVALGIQNFAANFVISARCFGALVAKSYVVLVTCVSRGSRSVSACRIIYIYTIISEVDMLYTLYAEAVV
jgi:zinc transporter ZupT